MAFIPPFARATEIYKPEKTKDAWLIPGIIPKHGLVVLASAPKTGKTCFATALARAIVKGEAFLGHPTEKGPVLWCAHEETPYERSALHEGLDPEDELYVAYTTELPFLDTPEPKSDRYGRWMADMEAPYVFLQAQEVGAKLIVIDSLHAAVCRLNLAENQSARFVMGRLRRWSMHFGIAVLVLHHLTKSATRGHHPERFADSAQILAAASCHFFLERHDTEQNESRLVLHGRGRHPAPFARLELRSHGVLDYRVAEQIQKPSTRLTVEDRVIAVLEEGDVLTAAQVATRAQAGPSTVRGILNSLLERNKIETAKSTDRAPRYRINDLLTNEIPRGSQQQQHIRLEKTKAGRRTRPAKVKVCDTGC